ncbi:MAG: CPBP family intramembrane metalloprotease [Desulfurococcales archaeon]|nr:CPBP family intramembrane metalloprotease [Desulfurococcales archaeon]
MLDAVTKRVLTYLSIAFILSYLVDFAVYAAPESRLTLLSIYLPLRMFIPLAGVLVALALTGGFMEGLRRYGLSLSGLKVWHVLAALGIPFVAEGFGLLYAGIAGGPVQNPVNFLIQHGLIGPRINSWGFLALMIVQTLMAGLTINAFFAFGEEIGWRGLLQSELTWKLGKYLTPLIVGVIWGLWHAPLIILFGYEYQYHRDALGVAAFTAFAVIWGCILYEVRSWSGSILPPAVLHGTLNAVASLSFMALPIRDTLIGVPVGVFGMLGALTALALMLIIKALRIPRWRGAEGVGGESPQEIHEGG